MRERYIRAFAVAVVASYALNSQNFRSVLTPIVVGVLVPEGPLKGNYTCTNAHGQFPREERFFVNENHVRIRYAGRWAFARGDTVLLKQLRKAEKTPRR